MSKSPSELAHDVAQECISRSPVVILGSGASVAHGIPGMPELGNHILGTHLESKIAEDKKTWNAFLERLRQIDLEGALTEIRLTETATMHIVRTTWDYLAPYDQKLFYKLVAGETELPLTRLFLHLFRSTQQEINVVTPNYDCIAEYASDVGGISHYTGLVTATVGLELVGIDQDYSMGVEGPEPSTCGKYMDHLIGLKIHRALSKQYRSQANGQNI